MTPGQNILRLLADRRWTQADAARRAGVSPQYLGALAHDRKSPSVRTLARFARAWACNLTDLVQ